MARVSLILYLGPTPAIPLYLIPRRKDRARVAKDALAQGRITSEFTAALRDPGVILYPRVEVLVALAVTVLMVTKPF